jgi:uncharacterized protein YjdB
MTRKKLLSTIVLLLSALVSYGQLPAWGIAIGSPGNDMGRACKVAPNGNVFLAGGFRGTIDLDPSAAVFNVTSAGQEDLFVACYTPAGAFIWGFRVGGTGYEGAWEMAFDASSNVSIVGWHHGGADFDPGTGVSIMPFAGGGTLSWEGDGYVAKYTSAGAFMWAKGLGGNTDFDLTAAVATDGAGCTYVGGVFSGSMVISATITLGPNTNYIIKYDPDGNIVWARNFGSAADGQTRSMIIKGQYIYSTGYFRAVSDFSPWTAPTILTSSGVYDGYVAKHDTAGNLIFVKQFSGTSADDEGLNIKLDAADNIYIAGTTLSPSMTFNMASPGTSTVTAPGGGGNLDIFIAKYSNSGVYQWARLFGSTGADMGWGVDVLGSSLYVTGQFANTVDFDPSAATASFTSSGALDGYTMKYDLNGNYLCGFKIGSTSDDIGFAIGHDLSGNMYATGKFGGTATDFDPTGTTLALTSNGGADAFLVKYDPSVGACSTSSGGTACDIWQNVGSAGFSAGLASYTSIAVDGSGTPYVAYMDHANGNKASVMKYNGSSWVNVGSAGFSAAEAYFTSIAVDGTGTPYVAYRDFANDFKASVMKYNGSSWVAVGSLGFSGGEANNISLVIGPGNTPHVAYRDVANGNRATVMKYSGSTWAPVGTPGFSADGVDFTSLAIDASGTPYIVFADDAYTQKATVMKYAGGSWAIVGSGGISVSQIGSPSIAIDAGGTPFIAYKDYGNSGKATAMKYTGGSWAPVGAAGFTAAYADYTTIAIDGSGTPYVGFRDAASAYKTSVMRYSGGSWSIVTNAGFSAGVAYYPSIAIDNSGGVYIAYSDHVNSDKATVQKLVSVANSITGTLAVCIGSVTTLVNSTAGGTWASSHTYIADISATGVVTGINAGTATISYTLPGSCVATEVVTVSALPVGIIGASAVCENLTSTLTSATAGGTWSSSNTAKAVVGASSGVVTGISSGTAIITYTHGIGCFTTKVITVNQAPSSINGTRTVCVGSTTTLSNATLPAASWATSNATIATINPGTGVVMGVAAGTANITYTVGSGCITTAVVTVNGIPATIGGSSNVCLGRTTTLSNAVSGGTWGSSNAAIASVGITNGVVTGVATGTAIITYATGAGCYKTKSITSNANPATSSGYKIACVGLTTTLTNVSGGAWGSSDTFTAKATVGGTNSIITGVAPGTANITFTLGATGCYNVTQVTVNAVPPAITGTANVCVGLHTTLANTTPGGSWSSSNTVYANVGSATGIVTAGGIPGLATISYSFGASCRATTVVTVRQIPAVINGLPAICIGTTVTFNSSTTGGTWSSSDITKATVVPGASSSYGAVTGISSGVTILSYTNAPSCTRTRTVTVNACTRAANTTGSGDIEYDNVAVSLHPNPTTGTFTITAYDAGTLQVHTMEGKELVSYRINKGETQITLPRAIAAGVYMCRYIGADGSAVMVRLVLNP